MIFHQRIFLRPLENAGIQIWVEYLGEDGENIKTHDLILALSRMLGKLK
jgi:hypothetical protein